jgi:hypothetical protein
MSNQKGFTPAAISALVAGDLENFLAASTPGGIEAQEAAGQRTFVNSATLPREILNGKREDLEAMGIVFGDNADDLFVNVTLPEGWTKQATDHSMWSDLLDDKGRKRAAIFYKAAFYARNAHLSLNRRFGFTTYESCDAEGNDADYNEATHQKVVIWDGGEEIKVIGLWEKQDYKAADPLGAEARDWLQENYPDWQNPMAYWG